MNREPRTATCRYEQAVYGSFPFWDRGYALLAHSPGCRPEWLDAFCSACRHFGERPRGSSGPFPGAMFSTRLEGSRGPWLVVGVESPGADDHGRPDALAFHALIVEDREFRKASYDPFALSGCLRNDWGPGTRSLAAGSCAVARGAGPPPKAEGDAGRVAAALCRGKRVAIEADSPIDALARSVWAALPEKCRRSASVATWAFGNDLKFSLLATPRLAAVELDASYVDPFAAPTPARRARSILRPAVIAAVLGLATIAAIAYAMWPSGRDANRPDEPGPPAPPSRSRAVSSARGPDPSSYRKDPDDPAETRVVERGLAQFAGRFLGLEPDAARGPTAWMQAAAALRYEGPFLSAAERDAIARGSASGKSRALAWDAHVRKFAPDRPLPPGFASGPLRWQLDTLAWSFHLELSPTLTAAEFPGAIADALAMDEPVRPNPLEVEYPALAEYAKFLRRLPTR